MTMHETEEFGRGDTWHRFAVPSGWMYWYYNDRSETRVVPDDYADHVIAYRHQQTAKYGLPLPAYLRAPDSDARAPLLAELAVALELDPEAVFDAIIDRAREVIASLKRAEAGAEVES